MHHVGNGCHSLAPWYVEGPQSKSDRWSSAKGWYTNRGKPHQVKYQTKPCTVLTNRLYNENMIYRLWVLLDERIMRTRSDRVTVKDRTMLWILKDGI